MAEALKAAFPYPPYDIQQQFMINVVDTLEKRQIGLFESPTGVNHPDDILCKKESVRNSADCLKGALPPYCLPTLVCRHWQNPQRHMQHPSLA